MSTFHQTRPVKDYRLANNWILLSTQLQRKITLIYCVGFMDETNVYCDDHRLISTMVYRTGRRVIYRAEFAYRFVMQISRLNLSQIIPLHDSFIHFSFIVHPYCYICNTGPVQLYIPNYNTCTASKM